MKPEEARTSPIRHILTRNLGSGENVDPEVYELEPSLNDRFILCTDGLTDLVRDEEILQMTQEEDHPEPLCRKLVEKALSRGAHDNTTVVSIFLSGNKERTGGFMQRLGSFLGGFPRKLKKDY